MSAADRARELVDYVLTTDRADAEEVIRRELARVDAAEVGRDQARTRSAGHAVALSHRERAISRYKLELDATLARVRKLEVERDELSQKFKELDTAVRRCNGFVHKTHPLARTNCFCPDYEPCRCPPRKVPRGAHADDCPGCALKALLATHAETAPPDQPVAPAAIACILPHADHWKAATDQELRFLEQSCGLPTAEPAPPPAPSEKEPTISCDAGCGPKPRARTRKGPK